MKCLSKFIEELESLKEKHGDVPVITSDVSGDFFSGSIGDDDSIARFGEKEAWDWRERKIIDCIVIL
jgi:hypothetical protein